MTYWSLNLPFLAVAAAVAVAALLARRSPGWRWIGLTAVAVLLLTVIFDNVLVGVGIVGYDPKLISGVLIGVGDKDHEVGLISAVRKRHVGRGSVPLDLVQRP